MLTPIMERHSLNSIRKDTGTQTPLVTQRSYRSPSRNLEKESSFYNNSFTISPTQRPSYSTIKSQQDPANNPDKSINHSTSTTFFNSRSIERTPSKSNSASRLVEMLMAENVRLERLQKNLDYILLQTSELAKSPKTPLPVCDPGPIHQKTYPREQHCYSPISPLVKPTNHSTRYDQYDQYDQSPGSPLDVLDNTPSSFHNHFHASPPANLLMSSPPPPPPPPPPAPTMSPKIKTLIQTSKNDGDLCKDKNVLEKHLEPNSPHRLSGLLEEIPKAKLKSARIIRSPSGRRVSNQFWKEIHKDKLNKRVLQEENLFPSYKRPRTGSDLLENYQSLAQDSQISKPKDNEDAFWKSDGGSSAFNEKLFRVAREERKENHRRAKSPLQSTLGDELKKADNAELQASKEGKNNARSSFSSQRVQGSDRPQRNQVMLTELQQKFKEKQNLWQIKAWSDFCLG
ncbi:hypothetical protein CLU79DRAFT_272554 [Phycomyces nitens]|nr:hypothetical protein CLU79DRAFT_272554 [Phycomyces nitens]